MASPVRSPRTPSQSPARRARPDPRRAKSDGPLFINTSYTDTTISPHPSPRFQQAHLTTSPHSPLQPSPHYRTTSPRPHILALDSAAELARRHTTPTPTASPRRGQFGLQRSASPALSRDGTERGGVRQRSRTEPSSTKLAYGVAGEQYGVLPEMVGEQRRERERAHGEGHARKSSAYAALAALSGLGVGHPSSSRHHARAGSLNGYAPHLQPTNGPGAHGNGPPTPGSTPPLSADVRDETNTSESEEGEYEDDSESGHGHRRRRRTRGGNGRLLTPPATPPRCSLVVVAGADDGAVDGACANGCLHPHDGEPRPTFNARKASAQCRQLEGYVSFAAVEGLGEPPSPGPDGDLDDEDASKRKRGSLGAGIVGFWKSGFW
ncbi:hypothetical protein MVEN_00849400 [Mycena venus]|uniref:Uncharacterized protein n=1 Tax=Mycena venus TaxID=2733690 RepID=A0A8H6YBJ7_9AGAR|nr:hypothetical protein MVEN_00849400 [Mycena venus]